MSFLFGGDKRSAYDKAKDQTRAFSAQVRHEKRQIDRQINQCDREIQRITNDIRKNALNSNKDALRILAKGIINIKHNKSNLYSAKANLDTIDNAVKNQLINIKLSGIMQKSTEIARSLSELMNIEQFQSISEEFSKELIKMGVISEMIQGSIDSALENDDVEEETDKEVKELLDSILLGKLSQYPNIPDIPDIPPITVPVDIANDDDDDMMKRLEKLRN